MWSSLQKAERAQQKARRSAKSGAQQQAVPEGRQWCARGDAERAKRGADGGARRRRRRQNAGSSDRRS
ncbi:MAG: hypothetical protein BJ554DRAFT_6572 [Olpidium bornovanus]|uniref:Uncharacterized protein n=1 Tax=Olpidium bornovanus TaxID=278681 RepID=A0A8H8DMA8_9FUNG|nr:MAG: hypothetical protein BJ554DRAFT_6572 [Olpidium bornovanus]